VYDIAEYEGQSFLTMEFVDGEDLSSVLKRMGRITEEKGGRDRPATLRRAGRRS
jgi:hypothetical protein